MDGSARLKGDYVQHHEDKGFDLLPLVDGSGAAFVRRKCCVENRTAYLPEGDAVTHEVEWNVRSGFKAVLEAPPSTLAASKLGAATVEKQRLQPLQVRRGRLVPSGSGSSSSRSSCSNSSSGIGDLQDLFSWRCFVEALVGMDESSGDPFKLWADDATWVRLLRERELLP